MHVMYSECQVLAALVFISPCFFPRSQPSFCGDYDKEFLALVVAQCCKNTSYSESF